MIEERTFFEVLYQLWLLSIAQEPILQILFHLHAYIIIYMQVCF